MFAITYYMKVVICRQQEDDTGERTKAVTEWHVPDPIPRHAQLRLQLRRLRVTLGTEWVKPREPATPFGYRKRAVSASGLGAIPRLILGLRNSESLFLCL